MASGHRVNLLERYDYPFQNQLAVARYFTEEMGVATESLAALRGVIGSITPDTDVSTIDQIVQIIGTVPPGG